MLNDENFAMLEALEGFASERGLSLLELSLGWLAAQPVVSTVIVGATSPGQVSENAACAEVTLSPEDLAALDAITGG